ncbi:MAG: metal ABC transporter substrate-binding protein [Elusimicrobiota bacterium]
MKFIQRLLICLLALSLGPSLASAKLQVVTTTQDLAALASEIGRDHIDVQAIAKGYQDPHFVDPKPSYLLKLNRADLLMVVGLELETGWLPPLLQNARNTKILPGNPGFLDASEGCDVLQKSAGTVDRSMGDVHPFGNPHYWTDPENGRVIARHIAGKLSELDPANRAVYAENLKVFENRLTEKEIEWHRLADSFKGTRVITYHNSWPNFAETFGLDIVNHVEPKPGIPPSPVHVQNLINQVKREKIPLLLIEPYFDEKLPQKIVADTGARMLLFPPSVGGVQSIKTYFDLFDYDLNLIKNTLGGKS